MEKDKLFDEQILDMINQSQQKNDKNNIDEGKEQNNDGKCHTHGSVPLQSL